jgi:2-C-methyl-D-erythritol 4-phosphate cytidylyltransferase
VPHTAFVVLAGGGGSRIGAQVDGVELNKVYLALAGRRVISWSFVWAAQVAEVSRFVLVVRRQDAELAAQTLSHDLPGLPVELVLGGASRHDSEDAALAYLAPQVADGELDVIAIQDGARPLSGPSLIRRVVGAAAGHGGALPVVPADGVLEWDGTPSVASPQPPALSGRRLVRVQTPQAFRARELLAAYAAAHEAGFQGTDTASSVEAFSSLAVQTVPGSPANLKITYPDDLRVAERLLAARAGRLPP